MATGTRRGLRKPIILTAAAVIAAPIISADAPTEATFAVYAALLCSVAWWIRYFFKRGDTRRRANALAFDRALEAKDNGDFTAALQWFALAANGGDANAMNHLGLLHMYGQGVPQSYEIALEWFQKAIEHGDRKNAPDNQRRALAEMQGNSRRQNAGGNTDEDGGHMSRGAALEVFDLKEDATPADIRAAYLRLMQQVHPDRGGSTFFAKQLNEARDLLLPN
jgi:TPR repeat protein